MPTAYKVLRFDLSSTSGRLIGASWGDRTRRYPDLLLYPREGSVISANGPNKGYFFVGPKLFDEFGYEEVYLSSVFLKEIEDAPECEARIEVKKARDAMSQPITTQIDWSAAAAAYLYPDPALGRRPVRTTGAARISFDIAMGRLSRAYEPPRWAVDMGTDTVDNDE
jgi:hypothetical protein